MGKMRLEIERLRVDTFEVTPDTVNAVGTVFGRMPADVQIEASYNDCAGGGATASDPACIGPTYCCNPTANTTCCPAPTWQQSCPWSCGGTCGDTCPVSCGASYCCP